MSHLECTACGKHLSAAALHGVCPACDGVLFARYDLDRLRREVEPHRLGGRPGTMWRFFELLPVLDPADVITLGEGGTPLAKATNLGRSLGLGNLFIKDEGLNPTLTFKARGMAAAVSRMKELGISAGVSPTAGNAGVAFAAYAAAAGVQARVVVPADAPAGFVRITLYKCRCHQRVDVFNDGAGFGNYVAVVKLQAGDFAQRIYLAILCASIRIHEVHDLRFEVQPFLVQSDEYFLRVG